MINQDPEEGISKELKALLVIIALSVLAMLARMLGLI